MENAAKSKQTQICHQIYPKNTLKRKNHKKVEIARVVILASDFRFFHTVLPFNSYHMTFSNSYVDLNLDACKLKSPHV